jgi:hypothetical protein
MVNWRPAPIKADAPTARERPWRCFGVAFRRRAMHSGG